MGGLGSGRYRSRLGVDECRALAIAELCDGGRREAQPAGEVHWCSPRDGELRARLSYAIKQASSDSAVALLGYRYWPQGTGLFRENTLELLTLAGRRTLALCPACGERVRTLYAPPQAVLFRCRRCLGLVYRKPQWRAWLAHLQVAAAPTLAEFEALPKRSRRRPRRRYVEAPPRALARTLEAELPLGEAELRFWCLRLRAAGLSYRQIALLTESSKSSVARICIAGRGGIDTMALIHERLEREAAGPLAPESDDPRELDAHLGALHRHALRLGLYRQPASEPEERLVLPAAAPGDP